MHRTPWTVFVVIALAGCSSFVPSVDAGEGNDASVAVADSGTAPDAGSADDAGVVDAGAADAGAVDAGVVDAGTVDAGALDAGQADAGLVDAGVVDAGSRDAGIVDAGMLADAGRTDAGLLDAGMVADAGRTDAGLLDAGLIDAGPILRAPPSRFDAINLAALPTLAATSWEDAQLKLAAADAGTRITLPSGLFSNKLLTLTADAGSVTAPIVLDGQDDGGTVLEGKINLTLRGRALLLRNVTFRNVDSHTYGGSSANLIFDNCALCGVQRLTFEPGVAAVMDAGVDLQHFKNILIKPTSQAVEVARSSFHGKRNAGSVVLINRDVNRTNLVENHRIFENLFTDRELEGDDANDFDCIRIGDSTSSQTPAPDVAEQLADAGQLVGNTVEFNVFQDVTLVPAQYATCASMNAWASAACGTEPEIISVKAPQSIIRFNTFRHCSGGLTLRHGFQTIVEGNYFNGKNAPRGMMAAMPESYGIRVIGENHWIVNNHVEATTTRSGLQGGISILPGQPMAANNGYWPVFNSIIAMNFLKDVTAKPVALAADYGGRQKTIEPIQIVFHSQVISGTVPTFVNSAPDAGYLSTFSFTGTQYNGPAGLTLAGTTGNANILTTSFGAGDFALPTGATQSVVTTSAATRASLLSTLQTLAGAAARARMSKLEPFLLMKDGAVGQRRPPLSANEVGSGR